MTRTYTVHETVAAAHIRKSTLDKWISRNVFHPEHTPEPGLAREFSEDDVWELTILAELSRIGLSPAQVALFARKARNKPKSGYLVIVSQPMETPLGAQLLSADESDLNLPPWYFLDNAGVVALLSQKHVYGFLSINLECLWARVTETIEASESEAARRIELVRRSREEESPE